MQSSTHNLHGYIQQIRSFRKTVFLSLLQAHRGLMAWKQLLNILHARLAHWTTHRQRMESLEKRRLKNCARSISFPELRMKNCWGGNPSPYHGWWKNENLALTRGEKKKRRNRNKNSTKSMNDVEEIGSFLNVRIYVLIWSLFTYRLLRRCDWFDFFNTRLLTSFSS